MEEAYKQLEERLKRYKSKETYSHETEIRISELQVCMLVLSQQMKKKP